jgi:hypothetical protein
MDCFYIRRRHMNRSSVGLLILIAVLSILAGCTVIKTAAGKKGTDVSRIEAGAPRVDVESALGSPIREWRSEAGVFFRIYEYDLGCKPAVGDAFAMLFMDVATAGLWEIFMFDLECDHAFNRVVISYDIEDRMLGAFREFDPLPPGGRSAAGNLLQDIGRP